MPPETIAEPPNPGAAPRDGSFRAGRWRIDPDRHVLESSTDRHRLGARPMAFLAYLIGRAGEVATKEELIASVWSGRAISDENLTVTVYKLRRLLGDRADRPSYIETVPGRGYRWLAPIEPASPGSPAPPRSRYRRWRPLAALLLLVLLPVPMVEQRSNHGRPPSISLAVLPLVDLSPGPRGGSASPVADSLTEALITSLARQRLRVVSRTSSVRFRDDRRSAPAIARRLGVDALLEGSVARSQDRLRVRVRLIDGAADRTVWSASYAAAVGDLLTLEETIASAVAAAVYLELEAPPPPAPAPVPVGPRPAAALDAYLRGLAELRHGRDGLPAAASFREAVTLDSGFADAHLGLAEAWLKEAFAAHTEPAPWARARWAARRALALDPGLAGGHRALAEVALFYHRDPEAAEAALRSAIALAPSYAQAHWNLAQVHAIAGRFHAAEACARLALSLDPLDPERWVSLAGLLNHAGRSDHALAALDEGRRIAGDSEHSLPVRIQAHLLRGEAGPAARALERFLILRVGAVPIPAGDRQADDQARLDRLLRWWVEHAAEHMPPLYLAYLHLRLDDRDRALDVLGAAAAAGHPSSLLAARSAILAPLRNEPAFQRLVRAGASSP